MILWLRRWTFQVARRCRRARRRMMTPTVSVSVMALDGSRRIKFSRPCRAACHPASSPYMTRHSLCILYYMHSTTLFRFRPRSLYQRFVSWFYSFLSLYRLFHYSIFFFQILCACFLDHSLAFVHTSDIHKLCRKKVYVGRERDPIILTPYCDNQLGTY